MGKYFLLTLGCQMNKNDSERLETLLQDLGLKACAKAEQADLILINTCSVRQMAEDRVIGLVYNWQKLRAKKPKLIIGVTGCVAGRDKDGKIRKKLSGADLFFPIEQMIMLPKWLNELNPRLINKKSKLAVLDYLGLAPHRQNKSQAFVTIQTGCNNFCTYCIVPYARGREKNRPVKEILKEVKLAVLPHRQAGKKGAVEITLLGQVVNNYKAADTNNFSKKNPFKNHFAALLWEINKIKGVKRLHFTAPDPQYFNDEQIEALKLPAQVNYLHLPAQSGDNSILEKMNRHYTREQYLKLIKKIRLARPEIALGTDIIVGFPGETKAQFKKTLELYKKCDFDISYHANYSQRPGTASAKAFKDNVPHAEKKRRWREIQTYMEQNTYRKNQKYVGKVVEVLVERCEETPPYGGGVPRKGGVVWVCSGNSREMKLTQFLSKKDLTGKIVKVKIFEAKEWILKGKLIN